MNQNQNDRIEEFSTRIQSLRENTSKDDIDKLEPALAILNEIESNITQKGQCSVLLEALQRHAIEKDCDYSTALPINRTQNLTDMLTKDTSLQHGCDVNLLGIWLTCRDFIANTIIMLLIFLNTHPQVSPNDLLFLNDFIVKLRQRDMPFFEDISILNHTSIIEPISKLLHEDSRRAINRIKQRLAAVLNLQNSAHA